MSKQRPNPDKIANELAGSSAFFRKSPPAAELPAVTEATPLRVEDPTPAISPMETRTPVRPGRVAKRQTIRHPFELYLDQLDRLRERADEQRRNGDHGSMSRMVREAIDRFLNDPNASNEFK